MPGFDGTGPQGRGPMTGKGMGFCILKESKDKPGQTEGFVGVQGKPTVSSYGILPYNYGSPYTPVRPLYGRSFWRFFFGRGRGWGCGRGRGRFGFWW
jgi:hypothetical protein